MYTYEKILAGCHAGGPRVQQHELDSCREQAWGRRRSIFLAKIGVDACWRPSFHIPELSTIDKVKETHTCREQVLGTAPTAAIVMQAIIDV